eukprot:5180271-Prymnesium_polylepis.1
MAVAMHHSEMSESAREAFVDELLKETGLERAQHTIAGLTLPGFDIGLLKGLSGGEKRRLSLGIALAKRPAL